MSVSNWLSFREPFAFWLLRAIPGPLSTVADLVESVRNEQQMLEMNEEIRRLAERQDQLHVRSISAIEETRRALDRITSAGSEIEVETELEKIARLGTRGVHPLVSPEIVRDPTLRHDFLRNPQRYGTISRSADGFPSNGLQILGSDREPILVRPSASTLLELAGNRLSSRRNLNSVSPSDWFDFISQRKLQRTAW